MTFILQILFLVVVAWIIYRITFVLLLKRKYKKVLKESFGNHNIALPQLKTSSLYWYPVFKVTFVYREDLEYALENGLTYKFNQKIKTIFKDIKGFDPSRAVFYTHTGKSKGH